MKSEIGLRGHGATRVIATPQDQVVAYASLAMTAAELNTENRSATVNKK